MCGLLMSMIPNIVGSLLRGMGCGLVVRAQREGKRRLAWEFPWILVPDCKRLPIRSALPQSPDLGGAHWHFAFVPEPDSCTAAKSHRQSITSSARPITVPGTMIPNALAVFRLMTRSNLVGRSTGKLGAFSPLL